MNEDDIVRLWQAVTAAAEAGDAQAFQLAFWRLEGGFQRVSQALWETRPRDPQASVVGQQPERARAKPQAETARISSPDPTRRRSQQ